MAQWSQYFEHVAEFDPAVEPSQWLGEIPDQGAVYLMTDAADRAVQLICVRNLRYSLRRRLGREQTSPGKHVDYRAVVRRVYWRRVDGEFEADWAYLESARRVFPQSYRGMLGFQTAWWLQVDPQADIPQYVKMTDPSGSTGAILGPMQRKHAAGRLIELLEDLFDLCRYEHILSQAPNGKACAYKEMGKCPAPCDGSISMASYRRMIEKSIEAVRNPQEFIARQHRRMEQAAEALQFEAAGKIKAYIKQLEQLKKGAFEQVRPIEQFVYVAIQPGPTTETGRVFVINQGAINEICGLIGPPDAAVASLMPEQVQRAPATLDEAGVERMALVAHHLFSARRSRGAIMHITQVSERLLTAAWRQMHKRGGPREAHESEGLRQELQEM